MKLSKEEREKRIKKFEELQKKRLEELGDKVGKPIEIKLPGGKIIEGKAYIDTPFTIAKQISQGLANVAVVAKVDDQLWDLGRVLEKSCELKILKLEDPEAREVYWHSSSHILGESIEENFGVMLCNGPPIDKGFYYDSFAGDKTFNEDDVKKIEQSCKKIIKQKQKFVRLEITLEEAMDLFGYNKFKVENLKDKVKEGQMVTVYRCGDLIDPCTGPHLLHTGRVKAMAVLKNSSAYWRGDDKREILQRVYGISFGDKKELDAYLKDLEEMKKRSHKHIGKVQKLWFMHQFAPGMVFFAPRGTIIYNFLQDFMKEEQTRRGFVEVNTPNMYHHDLFVTSGHWGNYSENMFKLKVDGSEHALKPMNCPGHCVVYSFEKKSYKDLPIRMAEYGVLHRNELKGALTGMTRVRKFVQDDAHIFCRHDQIEQEVRGALEFMDFIYKTFNFDYKICLSTRPEEKFLGSVDIWDKAEKQLEQSLKSFGKEFELDEGGGAFYGPKIDIKVIDSLNRWHQCATIQLDFNLPERFKLSFQNIKGENERPVMVHRAIFGSMERFVSILCEHCAGKWPFWMSPYQLKLLPVKKDNNEHAFKLQKKLRDLGFVCDVDDSNNRLKKKVAAAQTEQYNFFCIIGKKEEENNEVNVRMRGEKNPIGQKKFDDFVSFLERIRKERIFIDPKP